MAKTKSEERTGVLLKHPLHFAWAFKPADSPFYAGQTRIDWIACDIRGRHWLVEVKTVNATSRSFNLDSAQFISAGQKMALRDVARAKASVSLLIVWQGNTMYLYDWRRLQWCYENSVKLRNPKPGLCKLAQADLVLKFTRKAPWAQIELPPLVDQIAFKRRRAKVPARDSSSIVASLSTATTKRSRASSSPKPEKSTLTSRRTGSIRTGQTSISKRKGTGTVTKKR